MNTIRDAIFMATRKNYKCKITSRKRLRIINNATSLHVR